MSSFAGIGNLVHDVNNCPMRNFTSVDGQSRVDCDYQGRLYMKKVSIQGSVISHERYLYRGYLQIAALDMLNSQALIRRILWDPKEHSATRPLALLQDDKLYSYGHDFLKNVTELFDETNRLTITYDYSPYGAVTTSNTTDTNTNNITQVLQWSSEIYDFELALSYYNYRHYNPRDGRWTNHDPLGEEETVNLYRFVKNNSLFWWDFLGLAHIITDMTNGFTYWIPTNCCCEEPKKYKSLNLVVKSSQPGANDPYHSEWSKPEHTKKTKNNPKSFGENPPIKTDDDRGRWIHGGGTDPYQPLRPTQGCTRMHNQDVKELGDLLRKELEKNPEDNVPYDRDQFKKGTEPSEYAECLKTYNSEACEKKRNKPK